MSFPLAASSLRRASFASDTLPFERSLSGGDSGSDAFREPLLSRLPRRDSFANSHARRVIKTVHIYSGMPRHFSLLGNCSHPSSLFFAGSEDCRRATAAPRDPTQPIDQLNDGPPLKVLRSHGGGVKNSILRDLLPCRAKQTWSVGLFIKGTVGE